MPRYAIIENSRVTNIVEASEALAVTQGWVPAGDGRIGDMYINGEFVKIITDPGSTIVSPIQFKLLFNFQELVAIRGAVASDPILQEFYAVIEDPRLTEVDLSLNAVSGALDYLISLNLIAPERKAQIQSGMLA